MNSWGRQRGYATLRGVAALKKGLPADAKRTGEIGSGEPVPKLAGASLRSGGDGMEGAIWHLYRRQEKGSIRGDDGQLVPFRKSALVDAGFAALFSGQKVSYRLQMGWLGKEAVEVRPRCAEAEPKQR